MAPLARRRLAGESTRAGGGGGRALPVALLAVVALALGGAGLRLAAFAGWSRGGPSLRRRPALQAHGWEVRGNNDWPPNAELIEYKIPRAPAVYSSQTMEKLRAYVAALPEPVGYDGLRYSGPACIDDSFLDALLNNFQSGVLLPVKDAYRMGLDVFDILVREKTLGRVHVPEGKQLTVVGDLHGQFFDFAHMLSLVGYPSPDNAFLFNGDFVDRGPWSVEVMLAIMAFKLRHPDHVFLNRGNHESEMANHHYGFFGEVEAKYEKEMCGMFAEIFRATPLCHVVNDEVFVVHGGIPGPDPRVWWVDMDWRTVVDERTIQISLEEIENSNRFMEPDPDENALMVDLLWSDPKGRDGYSPSGRMASGVYLFGPDVSHAFMEHNDLKMIIRSHEVKVAGHRVEHAGDRQVITVFSAPNYVDKAGNRASVAILRSTRDGMQGPDFVQYDAQPHPPVPSGAYALGGPLHPKTAQEQTAQARVEETVDA